MTAAAPLPEYEAPPFAVRVGTAEDHAYVLSSWLRTDEKRVRPIEGAFYRPWQIRMMNDVLARKGACLRVAHPAGDAETIMGWFLYEDGHPPLFHYCYVRESARRLGIARLLFGDFAQRPIAILSARPHPSLPIQMPDGWAYMTRGGTYGIPESTKYLNRTERDPK